MLIKNRRITFLIIQGSALRTVSLNTIKMVQMTTKILKSYPKQSKHNKPPHDYLKMRKKRLAEEDYKEVQLSKLLLANKLSNR